MTTIDDSKRKNYFQLREAEHTIDSASEKKHSKLPPYITGCLPTNKNGYILDIGCGYGGLLGDFRELGYTVKGIDINEDAIASCKKQGTDAVLIEDIETYTKEAKTRNESYDLIIMTHVIEHLKKDRVIAILESIRGILSEHGILYIATPNAQARSGCYWAYEDFTHETIFTSGSIAYVLKAAGFSKVTLLDTYGVDNSRIKYIKLFFVKLYAFFDWFWNKMTGSAYHKASPRIYTWELKVRGDK